MTTKPFRLATLGVFLFGGHLAADKPAPPTSYTTNSRGSEFVFVMLAPGTYENEIRGFNEEFAKKVKQIRDKYPKSGLYKNDDSKETLWTVDWYSFEVAVASDGIHLIRFGDWPNLSRQLAKNVHPDDLKQGALSLYAKGKELRAYTIGELVDRPELLPVTVSHFMWRRPGYHEDKDLERFEIGTLDGNRITFDMKTGKIVKKERTEAK